MSTDRRTSYEGRHWALKKDEHGAIVSVHHFATFEMRNDWVDMDPSLRVSATQFHRAVKKWLRADPARVSWWRRLWIWVAKIGRR